MTKDEFNNKYAQYLRSGCVGLDLFEAMLIEELDTIFSQVFIHIPRFEYSHITYKHHGFVVNTNLRNIAGVFGQKMQDSIEEILEETHQEYLSIGCYS